MKKIILILLLVTSLLTGCVTPNVGNNQSTNTGSSQSPTPPTPTTVNATVVYFSCTNRTQGIAYLIANSLGVTTQQIIPQVEYTPEDLAYYTDCRADREQRDPTSRPQIKNSINTNYQTIFIGYPIWHGIAPRIIYTFIESFSIENKNIVLFATSGSTGIGSSQQDLSTTYPNLNIISARRFNANASQSEVDEWVNSLNLPTTSVSNFDLQSGVNGKAPTVRLNSGYDMPIIGLGTYSLHDQTCINSVTWALEAGFRLIDTAYMYGNEVEIGQAIKSSNIPREEIFIITKIYPGEQFSNPHKAINDALEKLDVEYIDMMLLHHPGANDVNAYLAMEEAVGQGKIRSLGLSNWYIEEIDDFISKVNIMPALIQNEIHIYYQEPQVIPYMHNLGIVMQAWYPLGGRGHTSQILNDPVITQIAQNHNVSSAQVILRWHLQRGVVPIPGSSNKDHIKENISVFNFSLTNVEMQSIAQLNRNEKHDWY